MERKKTIRKELQQAEAEAEAAEEDATTTELLEKIILVSYVGVMGVALYVGYVGLNIYQRWYNLRKEHYDLMMRAADANYVPDEAAGAAADARLEEVRHLLKNLIFIFHLFLGSLPP